MIESIRILGKLHAVKLVPDSMLDTRLIGHIDHSKAQIQVLEGLSPDVERETVLHEVIHAIEHGGGMDISEQQVTALSVGLWATAQANPDQMRWILGLDGNG